MIGVIFLQELQKPRTRPKPCFQMYRTSNGFINSLKEAQFILDDIKSKAPADIEETALDRLERLTSGLERLLENRHFSVAEVTGKEQWLQGLIDTAATFPTGTGAEAMKYLEESQKRFELLVSQVRNARKNYGEDKSDAIACIEAGLYGRTYPFPTDGILEPMAW